MLSVLQLSAQVEESSEPLYLTDDIPFSKKKASDLDQYSFPRFYSYPVESDDSKEIVFLVIPGGGYAHVAIAHEGIEVAKRLNQANYDAYVLFYRVPNDELMTNKMFVPLQDAVRALDIIREKHPNKQVAVLGFSAGGHLAATLSNFSKDKFPSIQSVTDPKVDYSILAYPVVSMDDDIAHQGSKTNLIGHSAITTESHLFSLEKQVATATPPTFIMHAEDDKSVPIEHAYRYARELERLHIPYQTSIYKTGGHGFGLDNKREQVDWFVNMLDWLEKTTKE